MSRRRTLLLLLSFISLLATPLSGQFRVGVFGGCNFAGLSYSNDDFFGHPSGGWETSPRAVPALGAFGELNVSSSVSLRLAMKYIGKGVDFPYAEFRDEANIMLGSGTAYFRVDYLEINLSAKVNISDRQLQIYVLAGTSVEFPIASLLTIKNQYWPSPEIELKTSELFSADVSFDAGAGVAWRLNRGLSVFAEAWYSQGILNITQVEKHVPYLNLGGVQRSGGGQRTFSTGVVAVVGLSMTLNP